MRVELFEALDAFVSQCQLTDDRVTRTLVIERAIKAYLRKKKAL